MTRSLEVWTFIGSNVVLFVLGGGMTYLALEAYWRERLRSLLLAAIGFGLITAGALVEVVYQFGLEGTYFLTGLVLCQP